MLAGRVARAAMARGGRCTPTSRPAAMATTSRVAVHWFRKGLRLHDNPALLRACEAAATVYPGETLNVVACILKRALGCSGSTPSWDRARRLLRAAVFVLDPWFVSEDRVGVNRMRFLLEALQVRQARAWRDAEAARRGVTYVAVIPPPALAGPRPLPARAEQPAVGSQGVALGGAP